MIRRALVAIVLISFTASVHAQSYARQVWDQLQAAYNKVSDNSSFDLQNYIIGKLADGKKDTWTFPLERGREYMIIGACDTDCKDMDLFVKDDSGRTIVKDDGTDDNPVTTFRVNQSGRFTIEIEMFDCADEPCFFGFGLFSK